jgi:hypothetical protein
MAKEKSPRSAATKQQRPAAKEAPANNQVIPIDKNLNAAPPLANANNKKIAEAPATELLTDVQAAIQTRAYELYEQRGRTPGFENEDWLRAEQEVKAALQPHHQSKSASA